MKKWTYVGLKLGSSDRQMSPEPSSTTEWLPATINNGPITNITNGPVTNITNNSNINNNVSTSPPSLTPPQPSTTIPRIFTNESHINNNNLSTSLTSLSSPQPSTARVTSRPREKILCSNLIFCAKGLWTQEDVKNYENIFILEMLFLTKRLFVVYFPSYLPQEKEISSGTLQWVRLKVSSDETQW